MRGALAALLVLACGCFQPDLSLVRYRCTEVNPACPQGYSCIAGYCDLPGAGDAGAGGGPDAAPAPDLGPQSGCAAPDKGLRVGAGIYACPGAFPGGRARELCNLAAGYDICNDGTGADSAACGTKGFFAARATACRRPASSEYGCAATGGCTTTGWTLLLMGCGRLSGTSTYAYPRGTCSALQSVLECGQMSSWRCGTGIDAAANDDVNNGVLCCARQ